MEKRSSKRIAASLRVEFDWSNTICCCTAVNLSEKGMLLRTSDILFPLDTHFEIYIHLKGEVIEVPIRVSRLLKTADIYDGIGIELIDPPPVYINYIQDLKKHS